MAATLLKIPEVVEAINLPKNTVYELIKSGCLKAIKLKSLRVPAKALDDFVVKYSGYDLSDPWNPVPLELGEVVSNEDSTD